MVKVCVVGTGFVGLTHAAVTARFGHQIIGYDVDVKKIEAFSSGNKERIDAYVSEKGLAELIGTQLKAGRLKFTSNPEDLISSEIFFMCLPTPYRHNGSSNTDFLFSAAETLVSVLKKRKTQSFVLFVNKSTVPVGTAKALHDYITKLGLENFDVASNPEFLPEGEAVEHAIHSSKVVVGATKKESFDVLRRVYSSFVNNSGYIETNPETAEAIKYASNTLLFTQIVAWQSIPGKIGEGFKEVDFDVMRKGILADPRVAKWGSYLTAGAGGSCFKKDALSLAFQLASKGVNNDFVRLVNDINEHHKSYLIERAEREAGHTFNNKRVALFGTAFKQGTNDMRESNVLEMVPKLLSKGVEEIRIYDPLALEEAKKIFDKSKNRNYERVSFHETVESAIESTDIGVIATDHQEFRALSDTFLENAPVPYLILDGRRMIPNSEISKLISKGMSYLPIGGTYRKAENT
ncbi:MAG: nucleotide sugar dehydrogenase [Candidatus Woesearchaeota archaeon]